MKRLSALISVFLLLSVLTGCYDKREIDDMAYVVAIGLDKGENNKLRMTLQIAVPTAIGAGNEGGGGEVEKASTITVIETPTIYSGFNIANAYISKEINVSHAKVIVFSEELAKEGLEKYIHSLMRQREFRSNMFIAVSRGSAEEYIRNVKPQLEANPAKFYEMTFRSYEYTATTANTSLLNFYKALESTSAQAVATLVGVGDFEKSDEINIDDSTYKEKGKGLLMESDFFAGDLPKAGESKAEIMGLAVFKGEKMVGELDGEETGYHLMLGGEFRNAYYTFPDPIKEDEFVILNIKQSRHPFRSVKIVDGKPLIHVRVNLEADITSIQSNINYEDLDKMKILENKVKEVLTDGIMRYLNKTKELGVDLCGFGNEIRKKFLTWDEWAEFNWLSKYEDADFNVEVEFDIRRTGLMVRSQPAKQSLE